MQREERGTLKRSEGQREETWLENKITRTNKM